MAKGGEVGVIWALGSSSPLPSAPEARGGAAATPAERGLKLYAWHVAITQPQGELVAESHLNQQAKKARWQAFLPLVSTRKVERGAVVVRTRPYFAGYIFVRFDPDDAPWRSINGTRGVKRLITCSEVPTRIRSQTFMDELLALCDGQIVRQPEADRMVRKFIPVGSNVRMTDGPFAGFPGTVELSARERVDVMVSIFGRPTAVRDVPLASVELVA